MNKIKLESRTEVYQRLNATLVQLDRLFQIMLGAEEKAIGEIDGAPFEQDVYCTSQ